MRTLIAAFLIVICSPVPCISESYGFFNFRSGWITSLGQYGPAEIGVKKDDVVKVDLIGSAVASGFYYSIVETTGKAYIIDASPQVITNPDDYWKSITTIGLFRANADTRLRFMANFIKGDQSGKITVFGLTLIATVVSRTDLCNNKIQLKSWKDDYLHRPDTRQGVTTWTTGIGNVWTIECK